MFVLEYKRCTNGRAQYHMSFVLYSGNAKLLHVLASTCILKGIVYMYIYFYSKICKIHVYMENNTIYD